MALLGGMGGEDWLGASENNIATTKRPRELSCRSKRAGVNLAVLVSLCLAMRANGADLTLATRIKAGFLFHFSQFTEWPVETFPERDSPLVIGIFGRDPFGSFLEETVQNETVRGHTIKVERYRTVTELKSCHILYLGFSDPDNTERVLRSVKGKPVLTVNDSDISSRQHEAIIKFLTKQNKIRFTINLDAAREARLTLSSKLLRAADEVISSDRK